MLFAILLFGRFWQLGFKPVHHDESINGWFTGHIWQSGAFQYDPSNYHGPLLFSLYQIAEVFGGTRVESQRFVTVLFSALTLIWIWKWAERRFALSGWWAIGLALSPGFLFFSRSGIHEAPLVFFTMMAATAWIDVWCLKRPQNAAVFLYGLTGMLLLKETFVIHFACALVVTLPYMIKKEKWQSLAPFRRRLFFHLAICLALWAIFYTGFGKYPKGLIDFFKAFLPWTQTGVQGNGHQKPFGYFIDLIWKYEWATAFAGLLVIWGLGIKGWVRGLCLWAILVLLFYSFVPYKTPWCLISIQVPIWLAAAVVIAKSGFFLRRFAPVVLMFAGVFASSQLVALNFERFKTEHPYVYVQSTFEAKDFTDSLLAQAKARPWVRQSRVLFGGAEAWPFVWWWGTFPRQITAPLTGGYEKTADLILIDQEQEEEAERILQGEFWKRRFKVRDARTPAIAYLRKSVFECPLVPCEEWSR